MYGKKRQLNFLEQTLDNLSGKSIGLIRLDSGFYDKKILDYLEKKGFNYIIAARFTPSIKRLLARRQGMHHTVQQRLSMLRYKTFAIGAYLAKNNGYVVLVLSLKLKQRELFTNLWYKSQNFNFPFKL